MKKSNINKIFCTALAAGIAVSGLSDVSTVSAKTNNTIDNLSVISRVVSGNNNGLLRYSYVDENGRTIDFDSSSDSLSPKRKEATSVPSSYDLRKYGQTTSIKDQGVTGACWAFAAVKAMESNSILNGLNTAETADYSENHLAWYTYNPITDKQSSMYGDGTSITDTNIPSNIFNPSGISQTLNPYDAGGDALSAIFTLATWSGAEKESAAPFTADTLSKEQEMTDTMKAAGESLRYDSYAHLQNADCLDNSSRDTIKKAIMNQGALNISLYYDSSGFETGTNSGKSYYQTKYTGKTAILAANHCVTLIGWDDNYSKNNFKEGSRPSSNGAWLIANSYGTNYNDNGYFWLSYEEPSINDIYTMAVESTANYENIYQYDGNGWSDGAFISGNDATGANVFTSGSSFEETLNAVSFYTLTDNQKYTIKIYKDLTGNTPDTGTLASSCTVSGTADYSGYHTVKLPTSCTLSPGSKFAVAITYKYDSSTGNQAYIPIETNSSTNDGVLYSYASEPGQSYIYDNDKKSWTDCTTIDDRTLNNITIKAFTSNGIAATNTKVSFSKKSVKIGKGETYTLKAKLSTKTDSSTVTYKSSNNKVVSVNQTTGKIKGLSKGSARITAISNDGNIATYTVNVYNAPKRISSRPYKRATIRRGRSLKVKVRFSKGCYSRKVKFYSSRKSVATVSSSGTVKARRRGRTTITLKAFNGKKAYVRVTVR
ncbi:Ig-like domain-containing protein [Eubacterium sp. MSJ-13]|uniref:lectin like domain-containing protein n=1 Tax=Eubacterium sp. MSJ-13 TaxID=2841513 RepID=UPI001C120231|nr:lectin like domain-containing protein [Eubacterium sp. MSJ-13]MBU5478659.1 Ig-like domain-containing protein [Eubacterium sp. MSJ-13]